MVIRHLTGEPSAIAKRASALLKNAEELILTDLVAAECLYVLESYYGLKPPLVAELMRSILAIPSVSVSDLDVLLRGLELYEQAHLDFAEAYLVARAELSGVGTIASFDKAIDRIQTINRVTS